MKYGINILNDSVKVYYLQTCCTQYIYLGERKPTFLSLPDPCSYLRKSNGNIPYLY